MGKKKTARKNSKASKVALTEVEVTELEAVGGGGPRLSGPSQKPGAGNLVFKAPVNGKCRGGYKPVKYGKNSAICPPPRPTPAMNTGWDISL